MFTVIAFIVGAAIGFGVGRIKNAKKLAAIEAEITNFRFEAKTFFLADYEYVLSKIRNII